MQVDVKLVASVIGKAITKLVKDITKVAVTNVVEESLEDNVVIAAEADTTNAVVTPGGRSSQHHGARVTGDEA